MCKFDCRIPALARQRQALQRPTTLLLTLVGVSIALLPSPFGSQFSLDLAWGTLPAVFWGLAYAVARPRLNILLACAFFLGTTAGVCFAGRNLLLENLAGTGALAIACSDFDDPLIQKLAPLGTAVYGIYLLHALFTEALMELARRMRLENSLPLKLGEFAVAIGLSFALVRLLGRSERMRCLTG